MLFHRRIYEWSGSALLLQFWEAIEVKIRKFAVVATPPVFADPLRPVRHHYKLIDEMRNGYSAALEAVLDEHLALIWMTADELDERAGDARPG
jgi:DNA-binding GntR family transcriptional regulator